MLRKVVKRLCWLTGDVISIVLYPVEFILRHYYRGRADYACSPIFIVGAPRTGSTFLYQTLIDWVEPAYLTNLDCYFVRIPVTMQFVKKTFRLQHSKKKRDYKSFYGSTSHQGFLGPSECGRFWYRFLDAYTTHYVPRGALTTRQINRLRDEIKAMCAIANKPFLFKNLNCGQRIGMLSECCPEAKFIFLKRDPISTINSIRIARRNFSVNQNVLFSVRPRNYELLLPMRELAQITWQVTSLEQQIEKDLKQYYPNRSSEISYDDLSKESLMKLIEKIGLEPKIGIEFQPLRNKTTHAFSDVELGEIQRETAHAKQYFEVSNDALKTQYR